MYRYNTIQHSCNFLAGFLLHCSKTVLFPWDFHAELYSRHISLLGCPLSAAVPGGGRTGVPRTRGMEQKIECLGNVMLGWLKRTCFIMKMICRLHLDPLCFSHETDCVELQRVVLSFLAVH